MWNNTLTFKVFEKLFAYCYQNAYNQNRHIERGDTVVELDQFKVTLNTYREPLQEVRDSL